MLSVAILPVNAALSQNIRGRVLDGGSEGREPLAGATVHWAGTTIGASADAQGRFSIGMVKGYDKLVASYVGYVSDTVTVTTQKEIEFVLDNEEIEAVVIVGRNRGTQMNMAAVTTTEMISFAGLTKMACCNLAESFENSASVTVGYSDAISGARQIRMLGLAGIYSQLLDETRPVMRGIGSQYALTYIPGMWLESIQVSKGVTSVTGGHEAMSGQINLEHRKPTDEKPFFINLYADNEARGELNYYGIGKINDNLSNIFLAHASINPMRIDHNGDGFMDGPLSRQINVANRWLWTPDNGMQLRAGVKYVNDRRVSGQMDYDVYSDRRSVTEGSLSGPWGSQIANENANAYVKLAIPVGRFVFDEENQQAERSNIAFILDYNYFGTDSYYGLLKDYKGQQNSLYFNGMYSWNISSRSRLVTGISATSDMRSQRLKEGQLASRDNFRVDFYEWKELKHSENEAGAFAEYNFNYRDKFSLVAGVRADYSDVHGLFYTPRGHIKWNIAPRLVLRASAGLGSRSVNLISDNMWALSTGRVFSLEGGGDIFDPGRLNTREESFIYGGSLMWTFRLGNDNSASLSADYFHTKFLNQVIADQEADTRSVYLYNLEGPSSSDVWQFDFNWSPFTNFDVFATFRYNKTAVTLKVPDPSGGYSLRTVEKPLTDRYKGLVNLQYATKFRRWVFDFTAQVNGPSRIPTRDGNLDHSTYSPVYMMYFAQVTWKANPKINVYLGCENIGNYTQHDAIVSANDPHSPEFNASLIWGPLMGRKIYVGARFDF